MAKQLLLSKGKLSQRIITEISEESKVEELTDMQINNIADAFAEVSRDEVGEDTKIPNERSREVMEILKTLPSEELNENEEEPQQPDTDIDLKNFEISPLLNCVICGQKLILIEVLQIMFRSYEGMSVVCPNCKGII